MVAMQGFLLSKRQVITKTYLLAKNDYYACISFLVEMSN